MEQKGKPNWWLVSLTVPLMIGLLLLESHLQASPDVHRIMEFGIVVVGFGLMAAWVQANAGALQNEETDRVHWVLVLPSEHTPQEGDSECGTSQDHFNTLGESDTLSEPTFDSGNLPWVNAEDDSEERPYHVGVSPSKGRYN